MLGGTNADNLANYIRSMLDEFKIFEKVQFAVTDNCPAILNAVKLLGFQSVRCMGHILNLIVKRGISCINKIYKLEDLIVENEYEVALEINADQSDIENLKRFGAGL